ncbi:hypothetical protein Zmor_024129 [Zophobas morio]|uniref:Uncharacterized protein n=1 Tax=Zophobas morio TaxID=2755281 RepID=A0AA38HZY6_9CUCU|nr:hypothetical protein Zmor_024126 [Zophobas morio]KAJ3646545.1 hypothetical protein Zmor_024129 [Zophobas morio]
MRRRQLSLASSKPATALTYLTVEAVVAGVRVRRFLRFGVVPEGAIDPGFTPLRTCSVHVSRSSVEKDLVHPVHEGVPVVGKRVLPSPGIVDHEDYFLPTV